MPCQALLSSLEILLFCALQNTARTEPNMDNDTKVSKVDDVKDIEKGAREIIDAFNNARNAMLKLVDALAKTIQLDVVQNMSFIALESLKYCAQAMGRTSPMIQVMEQYIPFYERIQKLDRYYREKFYFALDLKTNNTQYSVIDDVLKHVEDYARLGKEIDFIPMPIMATHFNKTPLMQASYTCETKRDETPYFDEIDDSCSSAEEKDDDKLPRIAEVD